MPHHSLALPSVGSRRRSRGSVISGIVPLALLLVVSQTAWSADSRRYTGDAVSREVSQSLDRRFTLDGTLRAAEVAQSGDGRFALHSTNTPKVGCDAFPDPIFANGFEP